VEIRVQDLVAFGASYALPGVVGRPEQTVTLTAEPGPSIDLRWGTLALADPWWPEALPEHQVIGIGQGRQPTLLSTIRVQREGKAEPVTMACAASIGPVDQVANWRPLVRDEAHFHLDVDSALGAFYDITDSPALRPAFENAQHMKGVYDRALEEQIVAMEVDGRVAAVVFLCPDGAGLYPVYAGYDRDAQAVAVLIDLKILGGAAQRVE
jgi:hypothetical protein